MDFAFTDEQLALQEAARRFAREEVAPVAGAYDQSGEFPRAIIRRAWELGLASPAIPAEYGGVGLSILDSCLVTEEIAWGCAGFGTSIMCNDLGLTPILVAGSGGEKDGDHYVLNGTKCWITNGGEADLYTVFATLDRSSRHRGICAFVVPADTPRITPGKSAARRMRATSRVMLSKVRRTLV